jgi:hypothetical protein
MSATSFTPQQAARHEEELVLYFIIRAERDEDEERLFAIAKDAEQQLSDRISSMVSAFLGSFARLRKVETERGSVYFWVFLATGYTVISQFPDFVRGLELLVAGIQNLLRELFLARGFSEVIITGGWTPALGKRRTRLASFRISQELITLLLASYLIVSHAVLLVVLVRIALKVLLPTK